MQKRPFLLVTLLSSVLLAGCAETQLVSHWAKKFDWPGQAESKGAYKVGNPYKVEGVSYFPQENFGLVETGIASWYGPGFHAARTANGEVFDQHELTAAHRTLQMPSLVRVTNLENGKSVVVRVNDRGPFRHGRIMDVSKRAAELLGFINKGTARVRLQVLERESRILAEAAKAGKDTTRLSLNDLQDGGAPAVIPASASASVPPVRVASSAGDDNSLPESLRTPTITVEELAPVSAPSSAAPVYRPPSPAPEQAALTPGHINRGVFMPDPVVTSEPVRTTGLFVQAGSFSVEDNAQRLKEQLSKIAPTMVDPVMVNGRQFWRVKMGPLSSVEQADAVLAKAMRISGGAKVVKN